MKKILVLAVCVAIPGQFTAQDIHFSQWFHAPQLLNPAETGRFPAAYRFNANQKTQWRAVSKPYTTFALAADGSFDKLPEFLSLGAVLMNDRAGDSRFNTFSALVGGAIQYALPGTWNNHFVRVGLQLGLTQIKLDYGALSFDNQFNGSIYVPTLPTGEAFARNSRWYANMNLGAGYTYAYALRKSVTTGWAMHNMNRPDQSFFNDTGVNLPMRYAAYITGEWQVTEDIDALPAFRYMQQATFRETILGAAGRYILIDERGMYRSILAGYFGRFGDSGIAMAGMEVNEWRVAVSYDINVSDLKPSSRNRGGLEFSVQYLMNRNDRTQGFQHKYCPVYL